MYIHLGNNYVIPFSDILMILRINSPVPKHMKEIIDIAKTEKKLFNVSEKGKEKSMIICKERIFLSPISSTTLLKRADNFYREV